MPLSATVTAATVSAGPASSSVPSVWAGVPAARVSGEGRAAVPQVPPPSPASLRSHLERPRSAAALYQELTLRARGPEAVVVRQHGLTLQGACVCCGSLTPETRAWPGAVLCGILEHLAHDLGLHLRLSGVSA